MILCLVLASDESGGLENHVLTLADNPLINESYQVHLIAPLRFKDTVVRATFHELDATKSRKNLIHLYRLRQLLKGIRPDIIHAHANKAAALVSTVYPYLGFSCRKLATLHSEKRSTKEFSRFDTVIGVSYRVLENVKNNNKIVIYNGSDIELERARSRYYLSQECQLSEQRKKIVVMGRLVDVKRFDLLISIAGRLQDCDLIIIGEGELRINLESLALNRNAKNVIFLGQRQDNVELLSAADLFVICSDREGFPYTLVESLRLRTPVVSTNVSDVTLIIPSSYVVPVGDQNALYSAIRGAIVDLEKTTEDFGAAFNWADQNTSLKKMIDQLIVQYEICEECH